MIHIPTYLFLGLLCISAAIGFKVGTSIMWRRMNAIAERTESELHRSLTKRRA